ncbi:uncharacterized protein C10orf71 homolog [Arapaima gigas]
MSSVNKRHRNSRGSMQGQYRYTDGSSDMSSVGGFMDETDREVSSLTDRAFRSLCIGEEAIYNDSDFTSPVQRHKAFAEETVTLQELFSVDDRQERVEGKPAFAATFQHSLVQMARQEHGIQYGPFVSNGAIESSWQHRRSTSRVSSLIQVFNSTDTGHGVAPHQDERVSTGTLVMDSDPWDRSGGLNFQNASGIPTSHPPDTLSLAKNYLFSSSNDPTVPPVTTPNSKASTSKFRKLSSTKNLFLHSEFSPFQTWKDYKRFQCQQNTVVNPATHSGGPQWYDSPLYKDLTAAHAVQGAVSEERKYCRKQNENRIPSEPPRSNVLQKASAIEKRCESEITSNCPPWRRSRNPLNGQLLANRPCTASLYNEKYQRQEEALVSAHRTPAVHHQVLTLVDETSNSSTPFNISQLLTPVIYPRQETETSEILNYSPSHDSLILKDTDPRSQSEVKQRDNYKAMASSLLFNLKDNRKREPQLHAELENTHHGVDRKEVKNNKEIEGLEYYALSNYKTDTESKGGMAALPHIDEKMPRKGRVESGSSDPDESRWTHHSTDPTKASRYTPQLDTLSPPLGKPTMFKVKDNTFRTSPVTKAVKPSFYKTFPEKGEEQHDHLTEHADLPAVHHSAVMSNRFPHPRQRLPHQVLSPSDMSTAKERGGYFRRNPVLEEDECCSIASVFSEDMEGYAASTADVADERTAVLRNIEEAEDFRDASERPEVKPLGKPPTVPPKTEKALRRAQKLTTRRIKKAEARLDGNSHVGQKAVRAVSSVPASPTGLLLPHSPMPGPPSAPRFCIETGYVAPAPNLVAQSFPLTQRKLLQDPNSGQYFVVDMPVQVKTKMFFDPETGKYVQLSVHQAPEGTLSPASSVELLNPPYVLYPGFLPMQVPSLPPLRSSSQMSAPATLVEDQERLEVAESWAQKGYHQRTSREAQPYIEPVYLSAQHLPEESSHVEGKNTGSSRNLSIISMSELEDFAVEST